jgi:hypothetical protein
MAKKTHPLHDTYPNGSQHVVYGVVETYNPRLPYEVAGQLGTVHGTLVRMPKGHPGIGYARQIPLSTFAESHHSPVVAVESYIRSLLASIESRRVVLQEAERELEKARLALKEYLPCSS